MAELRANSVGHCADERSPVRSGAARIFLLSPANVAGIRAGLVMSENANSDMARRLRQDGVPLGELFSFMSGLYFRGKLAYARAFAAAPSDLTGVFVITASGGLVPADRLVKMRATGHRSIVTHKSSPKPPACAARSSCWAASQARSMWTLYLMPLADGWSFPPNSSAEEI